MQKQIKELIDTKVNPLLASHGGSCELISVYDAVAIIRLKGGCQGCPGRKNTFLRGIKPLIMESTPGLIDVILDAN